MTYAKVAIIILAVLSAFSALIVIAGFGLMSAEDYSVREQAAYESFKEPENYDPALADLEQDEIGNFIVSDWRKFQGFIGGKRN